MKRIVLIGPFEGPKGGINVHLNRLYDLYTNSNNHKMLRINDGKTFSSEMPNIRKLEILHFFKALISADIVHLHSSLWYMMIIYILIGKLCFSKIIVTIHSWGYKPFQKKILKVLFLICSKLIVVNSEIMKEIGLEKKSIIQYAFIPPKIEFEPDLPIEIKKSIKINRIKGNHILIANAWQLFIYNNQDLYGLDLCIELAKISKRKNSKLYIIFVVSSPNEILKNYQRIVSKEGLTGQICIHSGNLSFPKLIAQSDIVLRPTNKDGDAITIREALHLNTHVVASDIIDRPLGTIVFKNRNVDDLYCKIMETLEKQPPHFQHQVQNYKTIYDGIYSL